MMNRISSIARKLGHFRIIAIAILLALFEFSSGTRVAANEIYRPLFAQELPPKTAPDRFIRVRGARLAWVDRAALRRDFIELRSRSDAEIDAWILEQFAYVSEEQLKLNGIRQTMVPVDTHARITTYRPPDYGRAAVFETRLRNGGLVDIKGTGHSAATRKAEWQVDTFRRSGADSSALNALRLRDHSDGLMSLGESIAELTRQHAAQKLFDIHNAKHGTRLQTIESYFIIALPFEILKEDGKSIPAGLYARQAHIGREIGLSIPKGIYDDRSGGFQGSYMKAAVDFGGVEIRDGRLAANFGALEASNDPQRQKPWAWGHATAEAFYYRDEGGAVYRHLSEMTGPLDGEWSQLPVARERARFSNPSSASAMTPEAPKSYMDRVVEAIYDPEKAVRLNALWAFRKNGRGDSRFLPMIERGLKDPSSEVQVAASIALGEFQGNEVYPLYLKALESMDPQVRNFACISFLHRSDLQGNPVLEKALFNGAPDVQAALKKGLNSRRREKWADDLLKRAENFGSCEEGFGKLAQP